ncbi:hypothetical protein [Ottowia thiooxydans]|nr:hypothetical protein [Ottowia thiooxydans]
MSDTELRLSINTVWAELVEGSKPGAAQGQTQRERIFILESKLVGVQ